MKIVTLFIIMLAATSAVAMQETVEEKPLLRKQRIERVINGLLPLTPFENQYGAKASLKDRMAYYHTPGVSIAVIDNYQIHWARGFGVRTYGKDSPIKKWTLFQAASLSIPMFAVAMMKLAQDKLLNLDQDINTYLATWKVKKSGEWQPRITLRQLLGHTAGFGINENGFPGYLRGEQLPALIDILNGNEAANSRPVVLTILPGTKMRYSGGGYMIAQRVMEDLIKEPFPVIMYNLIIAPLRLENSTYQQPLARRHLKRVASGHYQNNIPIKHRGHVYPEMAAAGLWSTPSDFAEFGLELQLSLKGKSDTFLSKESVEQMLSPGISENMGLGFFLCGHGENTRFFHTGANEGYRSRAVFYKHLGLGAVIMTNSNEGELLLEIERAIAQEYGWPGYFVEEKKEILVSPEILRNLVGTYGAKNGAKYFVTRIKERIYLKLSDQDPIPLFALSENTFFMRGLNTTIIFNKGEMTILQDGNEIKAREELAKL